MGALSHRSEFHPHTVKTEGFELFLDGLLEVPQLMEPFRRVDVDHELALVV